MPLQIYRPTGRQAPALACSCAGIPPPWPTCQQLGQGARMDARCTSPPAPPLKLYPGVPAATGHTDPLVHLSPRHPPASGMARVIMSPTTTTLCPHPHPSPHHPTHLPAASPASSCPAPLHSARGSTACRCGPGQPAGQAGIHGCSHRIVRQAYTGAVTASSGRHTRVQSPLRHSHSQPWGSRLHCNHGGARERCGELTAALTLPLS